MEANGRKEPSFFVEGMDVILKRDLSNHKSLLERTKTELIAYRTARSHEIKKKKHYTGLVGQGKYNDEALQSAMHDISLNIRHMSDKAVAAEEKIKHHELIIETLTRQLDDYNDGLRNYAANN